jgi:hypothetical protein
MSLPANRSVAPPPPSPPAISRNRSSPITIKTRKGDVVFDTDEHVKAGTTMEALAKMKPAFDKAGTVTAGNASGINDGAGFLVLADAAKAAAGGHKAMARLVAYGIGGVPNDVMGEGPIPSTRIARKARLRPGFLFAAPRRVTGADSCVIRDECRVSVPSDLRSTSAQGRPGRCRAARPGGPRHA